MSTLERPPVMPKTSAVVGKNGRPECGACRRELQGLDAWRCPWVSCRQWLRGREAKSDRAPMA